jgi:hypothetical protein
LETVEAILEALLDLIKVFLIDFGNPLKALIALLLAAVRAIINQIKSTGFAVLLVHPDFGRQDFAAVLQSVSGSYPSFEAKVVSKFHDTGDAFRPQYGPGSSVAMLVFYIGTETPGDLITQLFALMQLLRTPVVLSGLPAPMNLKVNPVRKSGDPVANFRGLFDSDLQKALVLEWQMPMTPAGSPLPGFMNSLVSFYNSFRFPNFVVERCESPVGELVDIEVNSTTMGKTVSPVVQKYGLAKPLTTVSLREENGDAYRNFPKKISVSGSQLLEGAFTGTYRYIDEDSELESGKPYWYRVRAYFGTPTAYLACTDAASVKDHKSLIKYEGNQPFIRYGQGVTMGPPSSTVRGFVPRNLSGPLGFNPYNALYEAVQVGLLLNFEFPPAGRTNVAGNAVTGQPTNAADQSTTLTRVKQRTGWGTLAAAAGQVAIVKASLGTSNKVRDSLVFKTTCRRIANQSLTNLLSQPRIMDLISEKWNGGVQETVQKVLNAQYTWKFPAVVGGFTSGSETIVNTYLALEGSYVNGMSKLSGPYPTLPWSALTADEAAQIVRTASGDEVSVEERSNLAAFLRLGLTGLSGGTTYLAWYSVTIGDLFPAFVPFIFDFQQWLTALLKALETAVQAIEDIILTLISKIQQLEQIIQSILALIDLLNVDLRVSVLAVSSTNGSADSLVTALMQSENKPAESPYGLHSGLVCTFGGPGEGAVAAFRAIKFILTMPV